MVTITFRVTAMLLDQRERLEDSDSDSDDSYLGPGRRKPRGAPALKLTATTGQAHGGGAQVHVSSGEEEEASSSARSVDRRLVRRRPPPRGHSPLAQSQMNAQTSKPPTMISMDVSDRVGG
jgi:hypothetical protein